MLSNKVIEELKREYKYVHRGLVQLAIKSLTREG